MSRENSGSGLVGMTKNFDDCESAENPVRRRERIHAIRPSSRRRGKTAVIMLRD